MALRAIWRGVIAFGDVRLPVKLYAAALDRSVHFRLLHDRDLVPLERRMVHPRTGRPVPREEIRLGLETTEDVFVTFDPDELDELRPEGTRDIEVTRFVPGDAIDRQYYARPYYLGPDGDDATYVALLEVLRREARVGIARWTMRRKGYVGALRAERDRLVLITLRPAEEVIPSSALEAPAGRRPRTGEVELARELVRTLEGEFEPMAYQEAYRERVLGLIEARRRGAVIELPVPRRRRPSRSVAGDLRESIRRAREQAGA